MKGTRKMKGRETDVKIIGFIGGERDNNMGMEKMGIRQKIISLCWRVEET